MSEDNEMDLEIQLLEKHGIPVLTKHYIGKVIKNKFNNFLIFEDNTCIHLFEDTIFDDQDDIHFNTYLDLWQLGYPRQVLEIRKEINFFSKIAVIDMVEKIHDRETLNSIASYIEQLKNKD